MAHRQEPAVSATGVWVDLATGHVVESEPEAGKLIVPPGGEIDQRARDDIAAAKLAAGQTDADDADEAPETTGDEPPPAKPRRGGRKAAR